MTVPSTLGASTFAPGEFNSTLLSTSIAATMSNGGSAIAPGAQAYAVAQKAGKIIGWTLLTDESDTVKVDVYKLPIASWPPTGSNIISGSSGLHVSTGVKASGGLSCGGTTPLTDWTTDVKVGDCFIFNATTITATKQLLVQLLIQTGA